MSLIVSASWSNSSPRPDSFTRWVKSPPAIAAAVAETLASARRNRLRTTSAPAEAIATTTSIAHSSASVSSERNCARTWTSRPISRWKPPGRSKLATSASERMPARSIGSSYQAPFCAAPCGQCSRLPAIRRPAGSTSR